MLELVLGVLGILVLLALAGAGYILHGIMEEEDDASRS